MKEFKRILIVNWLSEYTRDALLTGVSLARKFGAELTVLRVISNPADLKAVNVPSIPLKGDEYRNYLSLRDQYQEELDKAIRQVIRDGFPVRELLTDREPVKEIVRTVREEKIDLIIMLAHEEGRLEHLLFGSEQDALIRRLPCSVLLVKHEPKPMKW